MRWLRARARRRGRLLQAGKGPGAALLLGLWRREPLGRQVGRVGGGGRCLKGLTPADQPGSQQAHPPSASTASPPAQGASYLHVVLAPEPSPSSRPTPTPAFPRPLSSTPPGTGQQERTPSPSSRQSGSFSSCLQVLSPAGHLPPPPPPPSKSPPPGQPGSRQALGRAQAAPPR